MSRFQRSGSCAMSTWAFGPGWYMVAPSALRVVAAGRVLRVVTAVGYWQRVERLEQRQRLDWMHT